MKKLFGVITGIIAAGILLFLGAGTVRAEAHDDHCICGGNGTCIETATAANGHTANTPADGWQSVSTYDEFKSLITNTPANGEVFIYLDASFTMGAQIVVENGRSVHICLNGKTLTAVKNNRFFYCKSGTTLTVCDCSSEKTGTMTGHADSVGRNDVNGGNMYFENATFHLYSGTLKNGKLDTKDSIRKGANLAGSGSSTVFRFFGGTVSSGSIASSTTTENAGYGGNLYMENGTVYVYGGTFETGTTTTTKGYGGNIAAMNSAKINILGGEIKSGTGKSGGNIYCEGASVTFTLSGGMIHSGRGVDRGGNITLYSGTMNLSGTSVYGGSLSSKSGRGGNISVDNGTLNISGTAKIYGGTVGIAGSSTDARGGNIFSGNSGTVNVSGGEIYDGVCRGTATGASVAGGNADFQGTFIMTGGTFTGGTAVRGGNIALMQTGTKTISGGKISGGTAVSGGSLYINRISGTTTTYPCTVTITGTAVIENGTATDNGGLVNNLGGTLTVSGGTLRNGTASGKGGAIFMSTVSGAENSVTITDDALIRDCTTSGIRGGSIAITGGTLTISGGTISGGHANNKSARGGNISVEGGSLTVSSDAKILDGIAGDGTGTDNRGGNIFTTSGTSLTISGGTISGGSVSGLYSVAEVGGNVCAQGVFSMTGGAIKDGTAAFGGNLMVMQAESKTISGGTITGGVADCGGNIYIKNFDSSNPCSLTVSGTVLIQDGTATGSDDATFGRGGNIYVGGAYTSLTVSGGTLKNGTALSWKDPASDTVKYGYGGNIFTENSGAITIQGGLITGGTAARGSNVGFDAHSTLTLSGGQLTDPVAEVLNGETLNCSNLCVGITGVTPANYTTLTMTGGTIDNGSNADAVALLILGLSDTYYSGIADISGGTITADPNGIAICNGGTLSLTDALVTGTVMEMTDEDSLSTLDTPSTALSGGHYTIAPDITLVASGFGVYEDTSVAGYAYVIAEGAIIEATSGAEQGSFAAVAAVTGGGSYRIGDSFTLTAPDVDGYTFVCWKENGTEIGTASTYTGTVTDNATRTITAVYRFGGAEGFTLTVTASAYSVEVVSGALVSGTSYSAGSELTVKFTGDAANFSGWKNGSGKLVSRDRNYTFTLGCNTVLAAIETDSRVAVFYTINNQVYRTVPIPDGATTLELPEAVTATGKNWVGWSKTVDEILAETGNIVNVLPVYEDADGATYTLTVTAVEFATVNAPKKWTVITDACDACTTALTAVTEVTAKAAEGKNFLYFADENGRVLSRLATTPFRFAADAVIYAVYGDQAPEAVTPSVQILHGTRTTDGGKSIMNVDALRTLPEGYTIDEQGILFSLEAMMAGTAPEVALTVNSDKTYKYASSGKELTDVTGLTIKNAPAEIYVRAYVVYRDAQGNAAVLYSNYIIIH